MTPEQTKARQGLLEQVKERIYEDQLVEEHLSEIVHEQMAHLVTSGIVTQGTTAWDELYCQLWVVQMQKFLAELINV